MTRKFSIRIIVIFLLVTAGFTYLFRGCLSNYDERVAITPMLVFEKGSETVVFTIVRSGKAISYESDGGISYKNMNVNYFIQINDAATGQVMNTKKIKHNSDIKFHPVSILGADENKAWVFIGKLLSYDPFTLEKLADKKIIETKNPQLKGKLPNEKHHYVYNDVTNQIRITATDGLVYDLSSASLVAVPVDATAIDPQPANSLLDALKKEAAALEVKYKNQSEDFKIFTNQYNDKKISRQAFADSSKYFNQFQNKIRDKRRDIRQQIRDLEENESADGMAGTSSNRKNSSDKNSNSMSTTVDTFNGKRYGLLNSADLEKAETSFGNNKAPGETDRNRLYSAPVATEDLLSKSAAPEKMHDAVYLRGGFLLNRSTAQPIHLKNPNGFIVSYREKIGEDGKIVLTRIDLNGNAAWSYNTQITAMADWMVSGNRLFILGNDNKEGSSNDINLLVIIDLNNGRPVVYDYSTDKVRTK